MRSKKVTKLIACFATFLCLVFASSVTLAADVKDVKSIIGTIKKSDMGLVIEAKEGVYIVTGKDLSDLLGKKVKATGKITEDDKGKTFAVYSAEEASTQ